MTDVNENPNPDEKGKNSPKGAKKPRKRNRKPKGESDSNQQQQQQQQPSTSTTGPPAKIEGDPSKSSGDFIGKLQQLNIGSETTPKSVESMLPTNRNDTQPLQSANRPDIKSSGNSNVNPQQGNAKNKKKPRSPKFKGIKVDDQQPSTSSAQPMPIRSFKPSGAGQVKQSKAGSVAPVKSVKSVKNNTEGENLLKPEESDSEILAVFEENDKGEKEKKLNRNKRNIEDAYAEFVNMFKINFDGIPDSRCLRPNFKGGVIGKKVKILSNFFRLKLTGNMGYQYDIQFLKRDGQTSAVKKEVEIGRRFKRLTKRMHQILLQAFVTANPDLFIGIIYAYDNDRILITNNPLPGITNDEHLFRLTVNETVNGIIETSNYVVRIKKTVELALSLRSNNNGEENINNDRAVLQMIDIIMKTFAFQNHVVYGSKIFPFNIPRVSMNIRRKINEKNVEVETPFELAWGYHQSTQICQGGPMVNINQATAVLFKEGPLINSMCQLFKVESADQIRLDHRNIRMLDDLTYIRVETTYRGYSCPLTIRSFTSQSAGQLYFHDGNRRISVADYFVAHYKIHLNYPHLPCVEYGTQRYVPVELCNILPNQRNQRKLRDELIRIVSGHLRGQTPDIRCDDTKALAEAVSRQCSNNNGFNIQLVPNQVEVESRILPAPRLSYSNDKQFEPIEGDWDMLKSRKTFLAPIELKRWGLIVLDDRMVNGQVCARFVDCLRTVGNLLGTLIDLPLSTVLNIRIQDLEKHFKYLKEQNAQLICVIMPERAEYYSRVKNYGDRVLGIPTQVVLSKHYSKHGRASKLFDNSYLSNLLLKINLKLGGCNLKLNEASVINNRCSILTRKTMVVGIDVNHPSPGENSCSIAAVVGSIDEDFSRYRTVIEANAERDEIVRVDQMIVPILKKFKSSRGFDPEHIIVYRDGVSEGQFAHVMGYEILPLHKELSKLPKPPQLTYIIVQKRHNTRFYSKNPANRSAKTQNILPGSVIDTEICHYKWFDFYLCSQKALIGTARPGKYTVLWNSSPALADDLQMATYYLCYLFARATKSIADPAPARYAHHAAARGKLHFRELVNRGQVQQNEINIHLNNALNVDENLRNILYFS